jgi:hypothetical protein
LRPPKTTWRARRRGTVGLAAVRNRLARCGRDRRIVDYHGSRTVAHFRSHVERAASGPAQLRISTVDDLALWVNGRFHWFIPRADSAWPDFLHNATRKTQHIPLDLLTGRNELVFRVRGGVYASGGFFAAVVN